ncbi:TPA: hypothetical protein ACPJ2K_003082 [Vibrio alginolyticus]
MKRFYLMMPLLLTSFSWQASGASVSGTIDVSINLVQGCVINGNNAVDAQLLALALAHSPLETCLQSSVNKTVW